MIFPNLFRSIFIASCLLLSGVIVLLAALMYKRKNKYREYIIIPIVFSLYSILSYCLFLMTGPQSHNLAVFLDSLFFIGTDWMALYIMVFAIVYTEIGMKHKKTIIKVASTFCFADTILLIVNNFTHHMFDLELRYDKFNNFFWANNFKWAHFLHLGMCYIMVGITIVLFTVITLKVSKIYKAKYLGISIAYFVVIIANLVSYSLNFPIDISVILYSVLAGFICYYSTYTFPHTLLYNILEAINETINDAVIYFDYEGNCIYANKAAKQIFIDEYGFNPVLAEQYRISWEKKLSINPNLDKDAFEVKSVLHYYKVDYQVKKNNIDIEGYIIRFVDETIEILNFQKEKYLTTYDDLTGIYNRTGFIEAVDEFIKENGLQNHIMICSDIKDFKLINELFGEGVGDEILQKIGELFITSSQQGTIYGRIGDDNFAVFTDRKNFTEETFLKYIETIIKITESSLFRMHIYAGVYAPVSANESAQMMIDKAFIAISQIAGDYNKVFSYYDTDLVNRLLDEKNIAADFENAISTNQIKMFLQPVINDKKQVLGAEALCRWNHPVRGQLMPGDFIEILENSSLIYLLDEYIWEQAAKKLRQWADKGITDKYISVNVSEKDFFFTDIYKTFTRLVQNYDINPSCFRIEIEESVLMSDFKKAYELSSKLQKDGFKVAIDNFGSGYSSLNMLKDFKPNQFKLDMSLLQTEGDEKKNHIILNAIISMAFALDIEVIGTGVETKEQMQILDDFGCHIYQGHYLAAAMDVSDFEETFFHK